METYLVPAAHGEVEVIEKKSRFIGQVWKVETEEEALKILKETREKHREANHNVYAYVIRENNLMRYSDDGEPSGTSGMPALNVFLGEKITNVICIVTRYFGGTLLGTGGLARAYSKSAKMALEAAEVLQMGEWREVLISCEYGLYDRLKRLFDEFEVSVKDTDFGADIACEILVREDKADEFAERLEDLSLGKAMLETIGTEFVGVKVGLK